MGNLWIQHLEELILQVPNSDNRINGCVFSYLNSCEKSQHGSQSSLL